MILNNKMNVKVYLFNFRWYFNFALSCLLQSSKKFTFFCRYGLLNANEFSTVTHKIFFRLHNLPFIYFNAALNLYSELHKF